MTEENKNADQTDLTIQDLAVARAIIEMATERGTFKPNELAAAGSLYNKLDMFLKNVEKQAEAAKEGNEAAQTDASEDSNNG
jgi:hypothetical protein